MPVDHFSLGVPEAKLAEVIAWLTSSLEHMGFKEVMRPTPGLIGLGEAFPYLWIYGFDATGIPEETLAMMLSKTHIAFKATGIKQVRQFHAAALKAGGIENGAPGWRPEYYAGYYGAFVRDPACGVNFEVVFHACPDDDESRKKFEAEADE